MKACLEKKWKRACEIICSSAGLSSPPLRGVEHLGGEQKFIHFETFNFRCHIFVVKPPDNAITPLLPLFQSATKSNVD